MFYVLLCLIVMFNVFNYKVKLEVGYWGRLFVLGYLRINIFVVLVEVGKGREKFIMLYFVFLVFYDYWF